MRVLHLESPISQHEEAQSGQVLLHRQLRPPVHVEDLIRDLAIVERCALEVDFVRVLSLCVQKLPRWFPLCIAVVLLIKVALKSRVDSHRVCIVALRAEEKECFRMVVQLLEQVLVICVVVYHENLAQVFFAICNLLLRQRFHIEEISVLTDADNRLVLLSLADDRCDFLFLWLSSCR